MDTEKEKKIREILDEISKADISPTEKLKKCEEASSIMGIDIFGLIKKLKSNKVEGESYEETFKRLKNISHKF